MTFASDIFGNRFGSLIAAISMRLMGAWLLIARTLSRNPILIPAPKVVPEVLPGTADVVLYPRLTLTLDVDGGGAHFYFMHFYGVTTGGGPFFVHTYDIQEGGYLEQSNMLSETNLHIFDPGATPTTTPLSGYTTTFPVMADLGLGTAWVIPWGDSGEIFIWPGNTNPLAFKDVNGNIAYWGPVIVGGIGGTQTEWHIPELSVEFVSTDGFSAVLRVERTHLPCLGLLAADIIDFDWLEESVYGVSDPEDPLNTNKILVTVTEGAHTFGVQARYTSSTYGSYNCQSRRSIVVEVSF